MVGHSPSLVRYKANKTQWIVFNPLPDAYEEQEMDGNIIPNSERIEYLGMILDENWIFFGL
jgi:hypothetical protein